MKPIFETERIFLEERLNIKIPNFCWRTTDNKVFLNATDKDEIFSFEVDTEKDCLVLKKSKKHFSFIVMDTNTVELNGKIIKVKTWEEEYIELANEIEFKANESKSELLKFIEKYPNAEVRPSVSGGKDSELLYHLCSKILTDKGITYVTDYFNTTNDTSETFKHVTPERYQNLLTHFPEVGFYKWIRKVKDYYIPSVNSRTCCSTFKEGQLSKILDKEKEYIILLGVRKHESSKRAIYDFDINEAMKRDFEKNPNKYGGKNPMNVCENWHRFAPIVNWYDHEVWLYLLHYNIPFNPMYEMGFNRCGCLICPYSSPYIDYLTKHYYQPLWRCWMNILAKNYELKKIDRLYWTLKEWQSGKWKQAGSKVYEITRLKRTPERVKMVMDLKGLDEKTASIYFGKKCSCCTTKAGLPRKLNPDEIAMNMKFVGRFNESEKTIKSSVQLSLFEDEHVGDTDSGEGRKWLCKKCLCKYLDISQSQYQDYVKQFIESGCNLF